MVTRLRYNGPGYMIGIPARDLDEMDIIKYCTLHHITEQDFINRTTANALYSVTGEQLFTCEYCGKEYKTEAAYIKHELSCAITEQETDDDDR